jgi:hypothetical protein
MATANIEIKINDVYTAMRQSFEEFIVKLPDNIIDHSDINYTHTYNSGDNYGNIPYIFKIGANKNMLDHRGFRDGIALKVYYQVPDNNNNKLVSVTTNKIREQFREFIKTAIDNKLDFNANSAISTNNKLVTFKIFLWMANLMTVFASYKFEFVTSIFSPGSKLLFYRADKTIPMQTINDNNKLDSIETFINNPCYVAGGTDKLVDFAGNQLSFTTNEAEVLNYTTRKNMQDLLSGLVANLKDSCIVRMIEYQLYKTSSCCSSCSCSSSSSVFIAHIQ